MRKKKKVGAFQVQDEYFHKAKQLGYRARSAFKLIEIQEKFNLIHPGQDILDVGCAPGSFLQVIKKIQKDSWLCIGMDIQTVKQISGVYLFKQDIFEFEVVKGVIEKLGITQLDLITSDIAPKTSWQKDVDQYRSVELNLAILDVAEVFLKKWGNLLLKVFIGEDVNDLLIPLKKKFKKIHRCKPKACRSRSFEEYFVCINKV